MTQINTYYGGGLPGRPDPVLATRKDSGTGLYTEWNTSGVQTLQRPLTPAEVAEVAATAAAGTEATNRTSLKAKAQTALTNNSSFLSLPDPTPGNNTYLSHAAIPGGTLTTAALSTIVRQLSDQLDSTTRQSNAYAAQLAALTRQMNAAIRGSQDLLDTIDDT